MFLILCLNLQVTESRLELTAVHAFSTWLLTESKHDGHVVRTHFCPPKPFLHLHCPCSLQELEIEPSGLQLQAASKKDRLQTIIKLFIPGHQIRLLAVYRKCLLYLDMRHRLYGGRIPPDTSHSEIQLCCSSI